MKKNIVIVEHWAETDGWTERLKGQDNKRASETGEEEQKAASGKKEEQVRPMS